MATASGRPERRPIPRLHLVTDDSILGFPGFAATAETLLRGGGARMALHLRARSFPARLLHALAERLLPVADAAGSLLVVNDRIDVALGSGAHGVQLGARGMPLPDARRLLSDERVVGVSVHSPAEGAAAVREGADFLLAGTLYPTPSHPGRPGSGARWLGALAGTGVPVVGIGGITPERVAAVLSAGGHGVAVIRAVWGADSPTEMLRALLVALPEEVTE